jgi:hypothetical protein
LRATIGVAGLAPARPWVRRYSSWSRKNTQLGEVQDATALRYLRELDSKYAPGTRVADVPSTPPELRRTALDGDMVLEVPVQTKAISPRVREVADELGIEIRDVNGYVYNPRGG